jgi:hypothetical protein
MSFSYLLQTDEEFELLFNPADELQLLAAY